MLVIVVDDKKPEGQKSDQNAGSHSERHERNPDRRGQTQEEQKGRGEHVPPAQGTVVHGEFAGGLDQIVPSQPWLTRLYFIQHGTGKGRLALLDLAAAVRL